MNTEINSPEKSKKPIWKRRIIINAFAIIGIIILLKVSSKSQFNRVICYEKRYMESKSFYLKITGKYIDSLNHNNKTIKFLDLRKMRESKMFIINETGGFFNSIQVGDTLIKNSGDLKVRSTNADTVYLLKYNCFEKNKESKE